MKYEYVPPKLRLDYENESYMKKKYGQTISKGMILFLGAIDAAENAYDLKCNPFFFMEHLKRNLKDAYSLSLDKKKSKWRIIIQILNNDGEIVKPTSNEKEFLKSIKKIRIKEISNHYDEY